MFTHEQLEVLLVVNLAATAFIILTIAAYASEQKKRRDSRRLRSINKNIARLQAIKRKRDFAIAEDIRLNRQRSSITEN